MEGIAGGNVNGSCSTINGGLTTLLMSKARDRMLRIIYFSNFSLFARMIQPNYY